MVLYTMGTARIASLLPWTRSKAIGKVILCDLIYDAFVGLDHKLACIWTSVCDDGFKTIFLPLLHLNLGCNNSFHTPMYVESCMILVVYWIIQDPLWYSTDYRVYMGSSMIVWLLHRLSLYLYSYKLDGSVIARSVHCAEQSNLNHLLQFSTVVVVS